MIYHDGMGDDVDVWRLPISSLRNPGRMSFDDVYHNIIDLYLENESNGDLFETSDGPRYTKNQYTL